MPWAAVVLAFVCLPGAGRADADQKQLPCFSAPARLIGEGAASAPTISPRRLDSGEYDRLKAMFSALEGRWSGEVEERVCEGTTAAPRPVVYHFRVRAEAEWRRRENGELLRVEGELQDRDRGIRRLEVFWWFLQRDWLRFGDRRVGIHDTPQWNIQILSLTRSSLGFVRKFRRRTGPRASVRIVEARLLESAPGELRFREWFYVQDVLARNRTWVLTQSP